MVDSTVCPPFLARSLNGTSTWVTLILPRTTSMLVIHSCAVFAAITALGGVSGLETAPASVCPTAPKRSNLTAVWLGRRMVRAPAGAVARRLGVGVAVATSMIKEPSGARPKLELAAPLVPAARAAERRRSRTLCIVISTATCTPRTKTAPERRPGGR